MLKKIGMLLFLCLLLAFPAFAEELPEQPSGTCGEKLLWELNGETLHIFGEGDMEDFDPAPPWFDYKDQITRVEMTGVTKVGSFAFAGFEKLTYVDLGGALTELGEGAFSGCDGLTELNFPTSFRVFGEDSLRSCASLETIRCNGKFPSFRQNCLWDTRAKIYFPAERPWPVNLIAQLEEAFHGRVEFLASDGSDPYVPTEATEAPTTEETTTATTVPETTAVPTTAPTTEPVTVPTETRAPETTAPAATETHSTTPETEPVKEPVKRQGSAVGIMIIVLVLAVVALGAMAFRPKKRKKSRRKAGRGGKYSRSR